MKKILFAIAIVMMLGATANAQKGRDTFFNWSDGVDYRGTGGALDDFPVLPGLEQNPTQDVPAPLGSGLVVLTALGAGYVAVRKKRHFKPYNDDDLRKKRKWNWSMAKALNRGRFVA